MKFRTALAISAAGHTVALVLLSLLPHAATTGERTADAPLLRIERVAVQIPPVEVRPAAPRVVAKATAPPRPETATPRPQADTPAEHAAWTPRKRARAAHDPAPATQTLPRTHGSRVLARSDAVALQPKETAAALPEPTEAPVTATPAPTAAPVARVALLGPGPLGANYDPLLVPPEAIAAMRAEVGGHATIRVTVDAGGHATAVTFVRFAGDATLRERVRAELLAARYDAGECDGLKCEKTLEIST